jgi:hypothetical protein
LLLPFPVATRQGHQEKKDPSGPCNGFEMVHEKRIYLSNLIKSWIQMPLAAVKRSLLYSDCAIIPILGKNLTA